MPQRIAQFTLLVRDYNEAIAFYVGKLGFTRINIATVEDSKPQK